MTQSTATRDQSSAATTTRRPTPAAFVRALLAGKHVGDQFTIDLIEAQLPAESLHAIRTWGLSVPDIASAIGVSPRTILRKL
ncbi:MAG: hypothetical protein ABI182_09000, partial [Candidatus Baltobacteraceae bacterium]